MKIKSIGPIARNAILAIFFGFLGLKVVAQIFIPHGFWAPQTLVQSPTGTQYVLPGDTITFTATAGGASYNWSITAGAIGDNATTDVTVGTPMEYTARDTSYQNDTLTLTSGPTTINTTIRTYDALNISPASATLAINATQTFTVSNGYCLGVPGACTAATSTWSVVSGGGSISAAGLFTAPGVADTTVVQVADSIGNIAQATVTTVATLTITPATLKIPVYSTMNYSATLGTTPYTYSVSAGTGTVGCNSTLNGAHTNVVTTITVINTTGCPTQGLIYVGTEQICYTGKTATTFTGATRACNATLAAAYASGTAYNSNRSVYTAPSSTGSGTVKATDNVGASSDSTVAHVKPTAISSGYAFMCAMYNDGSVKCWGENNNGQLGIGSTANIGDLQTELGGQNSFVDLGTGRTATQIATGWYHACALLDDSSVKCWGNNTYGQLGYGDTTQRGHTAGTTPNNNAAINFGAKTPNQIWAFGYMTCAKFTDNSASCWGLNTSGQAAQGSNTNITSPPATAINFGVGRTASKIAGGVTSVCAMLDDASVKCWGLNTVGELGYGDTTQRGHTAGTTPNNYAGINLGGGRTATDIAVGSNGTATTSSSGHACAILDNGTAKCWGENGDRQIGDTTTTDRTSPTATGALGFTGSKIWAGRRFTCAMSTVNTVKCWGYSSTGQTASGGTADVTAPPGSAINWGTNVGFLTMSTAGRTACMITGGGVANNDRIKCWGRGTNNGGTACGVLLFFPNTAHLSDAGGEVGDSIPFVNH